MKVETPENHKTPTKKEANLQKSEDILGIYYLNIVLVYIFFYCEMFFLLCGKVMGFMPWMSNC